MTQTAEQPSSLPALSATRVEEIQRIREQVHAIGAPIQHLAEDRDACPRCRISYALDDLLAEVRRLQTELSTARARADSAVQDSKRLDELWRLIVMCDVVELFESGAGVQMTGAGDDFGNAPTLRALLDDSIDDWNRTRAILHSVNAPIAPSSLPQSSEATDCAE